MSCNSGKTYSNEDVKVLFCNQINSAAALNYYRGNEWREAIKIMIQDKSEEGKSKWAKKIYKTAEEIDKYTDALVSKINRMIESMLVDTNILKPLWEKRRTYSTWAPSAFELNETRLYLPSNSNDKFNSLKKELFTYRKNVISILTKRTSRDSIHYFFKDPEIKTFENRKKLNEALQTAIEESNVSQDDAESVKKIYGVLTQSIVNVSGNVTEPIDFLGILFSMRNMVFIARADALTVVRLQASGSDCRFDRAIAVVDCPTHATVGDTIEIQVKYAAYNSFEELLGEVNGKTFDRVKDGIAYHKVVIPNKKRITLNGNMTTINKSGVPKTLPWRKTIKILPK